MPAGHELQFLHFSSALAAFDGGGSAALDAHLRSLGASLAAGAFAVASPSAPVSSAAPLLHWAATHDRVDFAAACLRLGSDVEGRDAMGGTALHAACRAGSLQCARALIALGADALAVDNKGRTLLVHSIQQRQHEMCLLAHSYGARLDATDDDRRTALHWAAFSGDSTTARWLISQGVPLAALDVGSANALHCAVRSGGEVGRGVVAVAQVLLDAARAAGREATVTLLRQRNSAGDTPSAVARRESDCIAQRCAEMHPPLVLARRKRKQELERAQREVARAAAMLERAEQALAAAPNRACALAWLEASAWPCAKRHACWSLLCASALYTVQTYWTTDFFAATAHHTLVTALCWATTLATWPCIWLLMRRDPGCIVLPSGEANAAVVPSAAQLRLDFHDVVESGVGGTLRPTQATVTFCANPSHNLTRSPYHLWRMQARTSTSARGSGARCGQSTPATRGAVQASSSRASRTAITSPIARWGRTITANTSSRSQQRGSWRRRGCS